MGTSRLSLAYGSSTPGHSAGVPTKPFPTQERTIDDPTTTEFTIGDDDYTVVRYSAPTNREQWEQLLGMLLGCSREDAATAYDVMFPDGYDPNGTDDVALHVGDLPFRSTR
jgi:hypothetical protein